MAGLLSLLAGKIAVITGGATGIGLATAQNLSLRRTQRKRMRNPRASLEREPGDYYNDRR